MDDLSTASELDPVGNHFSPRSLRIRLTTPVPNSFRLPCIGSPDRLSPRRTTR